MYATCIGREPSKEEDEGGTGGGTGGVGSSIRHPGGRRLGDTYPDVDINRCDYLVVAAYNMKLHHVVITFFGAILVGVALMADLDEADTTSACFFSLIHDLLEEEAAGVRKQRTGQRTNLRRATSGLRRLSALSKRKSQLGLHYLWAVAYLACA